MKALVGLAIVVVLGLLVFFGLRAIDSADTPVARETTAAAAPDVVAPSTTEPATATPSTVPSTTPDDATPPAPPSPAPAAPAAPAAPGNDGGMLDPFLPIAAFGDQPPDFDAGPSRPDDPAEDGPQLDPTPPPPSPGPPPPTPQPTREPPQIALPVAVDDTIDSTEDTVLRLGSPAGLLANDHPGDEPPLNVVAIDGEGARVGTTTALASGALLRVESDGSVQFDPTGALQRLAAAQTVIETAAITVADAKGIQDTSTLTITTHGVNDAPTFDVGTSVDVEVRTDAIAGDLALELTVTEQDDGDSATWSIERPAVQGTAAVDEGTGLVDYLPGPRSFGTDEFVVRVDDEFGGSDTVTVRVALVRVSPLAVDDAVATDEDQSTALAAPGLLGNDLPGLAGGLTVAAVDGSAAQVGVPVVLSSGPIQGAVVTVNADGAATLDPGGALDRLAQDDAVTASIPVTIGNADGLEDTAMLDLLVTGVNDPPVIDQGDGVAVDVLTTANPGDLALILTATDIDTPGPLSWSIDTPAGDGTASVDVATGVVDYLPDAGFEGVDTFVVVVDDGHGGRDAITVTVTVTPPNSAPVIDQGPATTVTMSEDGAPTAFDLTLTATDVDLDDLTWEIASPPSTGTAEIVAPAIGPSAGIAFTPPTNFNGSVTFDVAVSDVVPTADTIEVTVDVEAVNDAPTVTAPGPFEVIGNVGITVPTGSDDLLDGASDPADGAGGLPLSVTATTGPSNQGGAVTTGADGSFSYRPAPGFQGTDQFSYEVCDSGVPGQACTTGMVQFNVSVPIWFVDNSVPAGGDGTVAEPFASTNALTGQPPGDVHLSETGSDYDAGIVLAAGRSLVGEGASGTDLAAVLGRPLPPYSDSLAPINGTNPAIVTNGTGITLASDNQVRGVDVEVAGGGTGIHGTAMGTVTIDDVDVVSSSGGPALDLANGGGLIDIGTVSTTNRSGAGIDLVNVAGTVDLASVTMPNPAGAPGNAVQVESSSAAITIGTATIMDTVVGTATTFESTRGLPTNDGDGDGIFLKDLTGSFTLNGGTISSFGDNAVDIRNSQDVTLANVLIDGNYAGNSGIQAHVGQDITITGSTVREIDDVNAAALVTDSGLRLTDVEGQLTIQDTTISLSEGYALRNGTSGSAQRAVELDNRNGCSRDGDADCTLAVTVTGSTFEDWDFQGLSLRHVGGTMTVAVDGTTPAGTNTFRRINGAAVSTGPGAAASSHAHTTTVTGSTFDRVGIAAEVFGSRGGDTTTTITSNTVTTTTSDAVRLVGFNQAGAGTTGTYRATVTDNSFTGVAGHLPGAGGGAGVFIAAEDSSVVRALVTNNTIRGHTGSGGANAAEALRVQNQRNGTLDVTFRSNTTADFPTNFFGAVFVGNDNDTNPGDGVTTTCLDSSANSYANAAGLSTNTHGFDTTGSSVVRLPGYTGTTDSDLSSFLTTRESTQVTAFTFGNQPVNGPGCALP